MTRILRFIFAPAARVISREFHLAPWPSDVRLCKSAVDAIAANDPAAARTIINELRRRRSFRNAQFLTLLLAECCDDEPSTPPR
jgi:hypothetical protein